MGDNFKFKCESKRIWLTFESCKTCLFAPTCKQFDTLKMQQKIAEELKASSPVNTMSVLCDK